ncbi:hypothetical protein NKOR_02015 [Candidatus Nitrosopumilus koreensis AR1]|uniref:Intracellular proteinase inhibitor BsuPI domain-containing protein n=1 Tax=Candidatus Nitrosopumilus koreensis AR1 TaxID=1229908 RepID=K0B5D5_9ARCH|nr:MULTISPECIES: hypothetical protein [Nitrosopumilus]AFS80307.1 hypothetical protein NKOR_02015 [Candidatus Nitrosopumilus koreensis AR1]
MTFVGIGILAGLSFGIYLIDFKNTSQLVYVEGPGISIVTEKLDFKKGEEIKIKIINTGTVPLTFSNTSYGLRITGLSGILMHTPTSAQVISELKPNDEVELSWDQIKNDGDTALEGLYKISAKGFDPMGEKVEHSTTVTIWK